MMFDPRIHEIGYEPHLIEPEERDHRHFRLKVLVAATVMLAAIRLKDPSSESHSPRAPSPGWTFIDKEGNERTILWLIFDGTVGSVFRGAIAYGSGKIILDKIYGN